MSATAATRPDRRRIHYVDESLQRRLLLGLVLVEVLLACGLAWQMHGHLSGIIEDGLYRAHITSTLPLLDLLLAQARWLLLVFFAVNAAALVGIELAWRRRVVTILRGFSLRLRHIRELDFSAAPPAAPPHALLALADRHRSQERTRLLAIRSTSVALDRAVARRDAKAIQAALAGLERQLPGAPGD